MGNLLYIIAVLLIISWVIGFTGYSTDGITHFLLVIAVIAFIIKFFREEKFFKRTGNLND